jgi:hypothetical protein
MIVDLLMGLVCVLEVDVIIKLISDGDGCRV